MQLSSIIISQNVVPLTSRTSVAFFVLKKLFYWYIVYEEASTEMIFAPILVYFVLDCCNFISNYHFVEMHVFGISPPITYTAHSSLIA